MSIFRRNIINNYNQSKTYVQDGLVFHLDGIDKGPNENAWTDLIGGVVFENHGAVPLENGWRFDNVLDNPIQKYLLTNQKLNFPYDTHTIEITYISRDFNNSVHQLLFTTSYDNSVAAGYVLSKAYCFKHCGLNNSNALKFPYNRIDDFNLASLSCAKNITVINGSSSSSSSSANGCWNLAEDKTSCIGGRHAAKSTSAKFNGIIHSIRIYNRLLTEEEMKHNQEVDRKRFDYAFPTPHGYALSVINGLAEVNTPETVTFNSTTYATLTDEEIAIATNKGWNVATD